MGKSAPHIVLFDLFSGGHHPQYLIQLASFWVSHRRKGKLDIIGTPQLLENHTSLKDMVRLHKDSGIRIITIEEDTRLIQEHPSLRQLIWNDRQHRRILRHYVSSLRPDHIVLMYFDHAQLSLSFDLRFDVPVRFSGIFFRPSFHYSIFENDVADLKERIHRWRKRLILRLALRNPHLSTLFSLDPYAVPFINKLSRTVHAVALPDGFDTDQDASPLSELRDRRGIEKHRKVALFFGSIEVRKGIIHVLEALRLLPRELQESLCLVIAGAVSQIERNRILQAIELIETETNVQVVKVTRYVSENEMNSFFRLADLVFVTYSRHIGSSGVLIRAAAAQAPVIGSGYGLLGEQIRKRKLGVAIDATSSEEISQSLRRFILEPSTFPFDPLEAKHFADENRAEDFSSTIFNSI